MESLKRIGCETENISAETKVENSKLHERYKNKISNTRNMKKTTQRHIVIKLLKAV
jgi:hypothetical protein